MNALLNRYRKAIPPSVLWVLVFLCPAVAFSSQQASRPELSREEIDRRADALLAKLTLAQKIYLIGSSENGLFTRPMPEIGLPPLKESDASLGVRTWGPSTAYAAGIGLAASWDVNLARQVGISIGRDGRARGVNVLLGPGVNIYRAPMDGRNFEFLGEDPYLAGQIAANYILGVQSQDVVATVKHFVANNSEYDRHNENSVIDQRTLREIYLPAFEAAVKEGHVGFVMDSYNLVNGEHMTQNKFLNQDVLKKEWGFRGVLMSDYGATYDGIAAANAGLDLENPDSKFMNTKTLLSAIQAGKVSEVTIDDKVLSLLRVAIEFGFLNHNQTDLSIPLYSQQSRAVALRSAEESMVLLKNEGHLLPLDLSQVHSIAVIGPDAYPAVATGGGSAHVTSFAPVSFMTGLSDALAPRIKVHWNRGLKELPEIFEASRFSTDRQGNHRGLEEEEFSNPNFSGKPKTLRRVLGINHWSDNQWAPPSPVKRAYRFWGYYTPRTPGPQRFIAAAAGGDIYRLYVNGKLVLDETAHEGQSPKAVDLNLPVGQPAAVRFDYLPETRRIRAGLGALLPIQMLEPDVRKIAALANAVVLSVGFDAQTEGEGHDRTYRLPPGQNELIRAVLDSNPHTILVLTAGGSVDISEWINRAPAFIQSWYGGSEAGRALAEVLTGKMNPSGKLPITWWERVQEDPAYKNYYEEPGTRDVDYREGIFLGYRAYGRRGQPAPLFPFGYGLSYTRFAFSQLTVTPREASPDGPITIRFDVKNVGRRAGAVVAEVYVGDPSATVPRPQKELKSFKRVKLDPGEGKLVSVTLNRHSLAYWSAKSNGWKVDPGAFIVYVGDSSEHVPVQEAFTVR